MPSPTFPSNSPYRQARAQTRRPASRKAVFGAVAAVTALAAVLGATAYAATRPEKDDQANAASKLAQAPVTDPIDDGLGLLPSDEAMPDITAPITPSPTATPSLAVTPSGVSTTARPSAKPTRSKPAVRPSKAPRPAKTTAPETKQPVNTGNVTWTLNRDPNPSADQLDAYAQITATMNAAVARYNRLSTITRHLTVNYSPGVPTAQASNNGTIDFGSNRTYMVEGTALHEMAHVMGVGQNGSWWNIGGSGVWTGSNATALVKQFDGANAAISTGGGHFWPYGLNYSNEFSETAYDRNVKLVVAMIKDGL